MVVAVAGATLGLNAINKAPSWWEKIREEFRCVPNANKEYENLIDAIDLTEAFIKDRSSVQDTTAVHEVGISQLQSSISAAESIIVDYERAHEGNDIQINLYFFHASEFIQKAIDAQQKLEKGRQTLKSAADAERGSIGNLVQPSAAFVPSSSNHVQPSQAADPSSSITNSEKKVKWLVGIEKPESQLLTWLRGDSKSEVSKVFFVHGTPGLGKTSLVDAVLSKVSGSSNVWIDSKSYDLPNDRSSTLPMAILWESSDGQQTPVEQERVFTRMKEEKDKNWVLVLDNASDTNMSKSLAKLLFDTCPRVRLIVTTHISTLDYYFQSQLASFPWGLPELPRYSIEKFKLPSLSMEDSRRLFCRLMSQPADEKAFDSILKKCGGSPLAIQAMCDLLILKSHGDGARYQWNEWSGSLQVPPLSQYKDRDSIRRMITQCENRKANNWVLYLSIFPLDCPLRYSTLRRLGMAEGYSEEGLKELVEHNFFQEIKNTCYGKVGTCRLNNLLHQIIISMSMEHKFAMIVAGKETKCPFKMKRLSVHSTPDIDVPRKRVERLIFLHVSEEVYPQSKSKLLKHAKKVKVLDLQRHLAKVRGISSQVVDIPEEIFHLKYLTFLSLRDTMVKHLPNGISKLEKLETLDLKGTAVLKLPEDISKLKKLRHMLAYRSRPLAAGTAPKFGAKVQSKVVVTNPQHGVKAPSTLGALTSLQTLCMIDLDPVEQLKPEQETVKRKELLDEIGKLKRLQRLGVSKMRSTDVEHLFSFINEFKNLEALRLIAVPGEKISISEKDVEGLPEKLTRVHLTGSLEIQFNWISSLTSLVKLVLKGSELKGESLQHLQKLCRLMHLELQQAFDDVIELRFTKGGFQELRFLGLDGINSLRSIIVAEDALPALETLSLVRCTSFETVLPDFTCPKKLKCLKLKGMKEFETKVRGNKEIRLRRITIESKKWNEGTEEDVTSEQNKVFGPMASQIQQEVPLKAPVATATTTLNGHDDCISTSPA